MPKQLKWILFACFLMLAGCASIPSTSSTKQPLASKPSETWDNRVGVLSNIETWDLKGLIAIRNSKDAWSANWNWQQHQKNYKISLFGPLGTHSMQLTGSPGTVSLATSDGKTFSASSPETLLEQQLGWRLPVSDLYFWIRGLPVPNVPAQKQLDAENRMVMLVQHGWRIEYLRYSSINHADLPSKMILNNAALNVKILINQWEF